MANKTAAEVIARAKELTPPLRQLQTKILSAKSAENSSMLPSSGEALQTAASVIEAAKKLRLLRRLPGARIFEIKNPQCLKSISPYVTEINTNIPAANDESNESLQISIIEIIAKHLAPVVIEEWVTVEIRRVSGAKDVSYLLPIKRDNLRSDLPKKILAQYPQLVLDGSNVDRQIAQAYDSAVTAGAYIHEYYFGGWHKNNGKLIFLNNSLPRVFAKYELKHDADLAAKFLPAYFNICDVEHRGKLVIALLFALYANAAVLWEEAGIIEKGLRAACYLAAPTGTGKTTLAKIIANAMSLEKDSTVLRFEDTQASLEESILANRDVVTVIDDFFAQGTKLGDAAYKSKASSITRIAGDGRLKGKMGPDRRPLPDRQYRGSLFITGEFIDLNTFSSFLRCWQLNFPAGSIKLNSRGLQELSGDSDITRSFFSAWIAFLEENQSVIIDRLPQFVNVNISIARDRFPGCKHARLLVNVAAMLVVSRVFAEFLDASSLDSVGIDFFDVVMDEAGKQLSLLRNIEPYETFRRAIQDAIDNAKLVIAANAEDFLTFADAAAFLEENSLFIISSHADAIVEAYCRRMELGLKVTADLKIELVQRHILVQPETIKFSRNRKVSPKRPRLYELQRRCFEL